MNGNGIGVVETSKARAIQDLEGLDKGVDTVPEFAAISEPLLDGSEEGILSAVDDSIKETLGHEMKGYRAWKAQQGAAKG